MRWSSARLGQFGVPITGLSFRPKRTAMPAKDAGQVYVSPAFVNICMSIAGTTPFASRVAVRKAC